MKDSVFYDVFSLDALVGLPNDTDVDLLCSRGVLLGAILSGIHTSSVQPVAFDDSLQLAREVLLASKSREESMTVLLFAGVLAARWRGFRHGFDRDKSLFSEAVLLLGEGSGRLVDAFGDDEVGRWVLSAALDGGRILPEDASEPVSFGDGGLLDQARAMLSAVVSGVCAGDLSDDLARVFFPCVRVQGEADLVQVDHEQFSRMAERFSEPCGGGGSFFVVFLFREFLRSVGLPVFGILSPGDVLSSFEAFDGSSGALFRVFGSRISMIDREVVSLEPEVEVLGDESDPASASAFVPAVEENSETVSEGANHDSGLVVDVVSTEVPVTPAGKFIADEDAGRIDVKDDVAAENGVSVPEVAEVPEDAVVGAGLPDLTIVEDDIVRVDLEGRESGNLSPDEVLKIAEKGFRVEVFKLGEGDVEDAIAHLSSVLVLGGDPPLGLRRVNEASVDGVADDSSAKFRNLEVGSETIAALSGRDLSPEQIVEMMEEGGVFDHEGAGGDIADAERVRPTGSSGWSRSKVSAYAVRKALGGVVVIGMGAAFVSTLLIGSVALSALARSRRRF